MSLFKRTSSGLANLHLFYKVEFIIYLEGGPKCFTAEEVYAGEGHDETEDIIFWKNVVNHFKNRVSVKYKSVGSKLTLLAISNDVKKYHLQSIKIAMDNEFDEVLNKRLIEPHIFYTHGYSYENDIWSSEVIVNVIEQLSAVEIKDRKIPADDFASFIKGMRLAVCADGYLFSKNSSFFPRPSGHLFCVDVSSPNLPKIKKEVIKAKIKSTTLTTSTIYRYGKSNHIETHKHMYGHLLADFSAQYITKYLKINHKLDGVKFDLIRRVAISKFFATSFTNSQGVYQYFQNQFAQNWP